MATAPQALPPQQPPVQSQQYQDPYPLGEPDRQRLDGIVQKMLDNGEPEDNVLAVVKDFKQKYSTPGSADQLSPPSDDDDQGFLLNALHSVAKAAAGLGSAAIHPLDTAKSTLELLAPMLGGPSATAQMLNGQNPATEALKNHFSSRYGSLDAAKKTVTQDPVGTALDALSFAGPLAEASGMELPQFLQKAKIPIVPKIASNLDAAEQGAVDFADKNNIPLDLGTRTGNAAVKNAQKLLSEAPGSSGIMKNAAQTQQSAMQSAGQRIAERVSPSPTSPEAAGQATQTALQSRISSLRSNANEAYSRLEQIENDPKNIQPVTVGQKPSSVLGPDGNPVIAPITKDISLPVNMKPVKDALAPLAEDIKQQLPVGQQQYSRGLQAVQNILSGDDVVSASTAEQNLGALKSIQRDAVNAKTKWLATQAIKQYSPAVDAAVGQAGPEAIDALNQGRQLTAAKYATQATMDSLQTEPVKLFNQLTQNQDLGINLLRDVASKAPAALPGVGRAYVEGLMDKAFAEAGQAKPGTVLTQWQKLGPSTKQLLFKDPQTVSDLDSFFTLAKRMAENPNPSGTATTGQLTGDGALLLTSPHLAVTYLIGKNGLARMLTSPGGARALSQGLAIPVKNAAYSAVTANQILRLAGTDAKPVDASTTTP